MACCIVVLRVPPSQDYHKHLIILFVEQDASLKDLVLRTIYKREGRGEKITDVLRRVQTRPNRLVQPVHLMFPGQIMRRRSLLGALVHARKDEIKRLP